MNSLRTRVAVTAAASAAAAGAVLAPAVSAEAASPIQIYRVYYNSPGSDNRSNASLNGEWVQIRNTSRTARSLQGWKLRDKTGYTYTFGRFTLGGRKTVTVHTGRGKDTAAHRYWNRRAYVWNNTGDTAYVHTRAGSLADSCSWGRGGSSKYC